MPCDSSIYKDIFAALAVIVALIGFINGLFQYKKAQDWEKSEFVASMIKDFNDNAHVQDVLAMLDYRRKNFKQMSTGLSYEIVVLHRVAADYECSPGQAKVMLSDALRFNNYQAVSDEVRFVRERFDVYLGYFEKFAIFIDRQLITYADIEPYTRYHTDLICGNVFHSQDYQEELFEFIVIYNFSMALKYLLLARRSSRIHALIRRAEEIRKANAATP